MTLYALCIAVSAFLLFLVQPVIARQILPWFGGSAAVWTTCMVFFQLVLLAGYAYSDYMIRRFTARQQAIVHTVLLLASLACLPITASESFKPVDASNPIGRILLLLAATIGLPYLMLSTTGPLVQAWVARRRTGGQVYRLYALSNVASMLALIGYPPLIEPTTTNLQQSVGWSAGYALFALLAIGCAWMAAKGTQSLAADRGPAAADGPGVAPASPSGPATDPTGIAPTGVAPAAPSLREQGLWLLLSSLGSVLLLAVTTHITQNVASIPFLWVLPLALYLITFILCFDGRGWYRRAWYLPAACVLLALMFGGLSWRPEWEPLSFDRSLIPISQAVPLYALGLFVLCMVCHGELVERKPAPMHLTRFYLMVSLGGALGGLFVGILAPLVFDWYWEFPLGLSVLALVLAFLTPGRLRWLAVATFAGSVVGLWDYHQHIRNDTVELSRNFYGALRVKSVSAQDPENARLRLMHGVITHGEQYTLPKFRKLPTTYYGNDSGVGRAILGLRALSADRPQRIGLVGLGVGTLAAYGRVGDEYRIYELNPAVLELARRRFFYLNESPAKVVTPLGDARLVLEREAPQRLDVLAVDAFSSDSIPVHLITREAAQVYRRHVANDGVIAFHISNRYLDLTGIVRQLADDIGWQALQVQDSPGDDSYLYSSQWVLLTANAALAARLKELKVVEELPRVPGLRPWTDDFNNLFAVLK